MNGLLCVAFLAVALNAVSAQQLSIPRNLRFLVRTVSSLDSSHLKPGDPAEFELVASVRGAGGVVLLPAGARFRGKVAQAAGLSSGQAQLAVLLTEVAWDGRTAKLATCFNTSQPREVRSASTSEGPAFTWSDFVVRQDPRYGAIITSTMHDVVLPAGTELFLQQCELPSLAQ